MSRRRLRGRHAQYLREKFLRCRWRSAGRTSPSPRPGTVCVVESEGNGRFCTTLPRTLITIVGIEKLLPTLDDLEVFLQLLPRSQRVNE